MKGEFVMLTPENSSESTTTGMESCKWFLGEEAATMLGQSIASWQQLFSIQPHTIAFLCIVTGTTITIVPATWSGSLVGSQSDGLSKDTPRLLIFVESEWFEPGLFTRIAWNAQKPSAGWRN